MQTSRMIPRLLFVYFALLASCAHAAPQGTAPPPRITQPPEAAPTPRDEAIRALRSGDTKAATKHALQMLEENTDPKSWNYGNIIYEANHVLGLAALQENRVADARRYLLAAAKTPGSPQLNSFGPPMALAQRLLERGEKSVVIQYLDLVAKFWASTPSGKLREYEKKRPGSSALIIRMKRENQQKIETWKKQIRAGKKPELHKSDSIY